MTLEQLKTFLWVARLGGVRKAAEHMHVGQPAISARLITLEETLGVNLFERRQQGMFLTKEGAMLVPHVEQIMFSLEKIQTEIIPNENFKGLLRIGATETIAQSWLPDFLIQLRTDYPEIKLEVSVDLTHNLQEQLINNGIDVAILMGPVTEHTIENIELPTFELGWFHSPTLKEPNLSKTPIVSYHRKSRPYQNLKIELMERYGSCGDIFPSSSLSAGFKMVTSGIGVGVLPKILAQPLLEDNSIIMFDPGWAPDDLRFTVSYLGSGESLVAKSAAHIAAATAKLYQG